MDLETILAQIGNRKEKKTGAISFPVTFSTAYLHPGLGESTGFDYIRTKNPTRVVLEEAIAEIEGGDQGFAFSSGMAAIQILFGLFKPGDHIIATHDLYGGSYRLFEQVWRRFGITCSYHDIRDGADLRDHLRPETAAVFIETPSNPMMITVDTESIAAVAKEHGALTIVDNTFLTPYYQRPIEQGADIVLHSATKYLGGHNDVLAGLVVTKGKELSEEMAFQQNTSGAVLSPMDSWLLIRGMKTLSLRMEKHTENAKQLVSFLEGHSFVEDVLYAGVGGMISFRVKDAAMVAPILKNLKLISFAESLGGVESLMTYPAVQTHADIPEEIRQRVGVCDRLLRISTGIESAHDLQQDLEQALQAASHVLKQASVE
ncbi:cystathionine gamma-synthase [Ammoniphilus oxalaticus]|uniref:Cystathionine gamma-synthase n=1 Tax=Ammoniphilus oxalaticus TaxID=66863 RepID=A0A419SR75_9BACL|nr:aminotransferase class I/II-fold pyridoxal phosphate-dependent enzyme [Ammoniphilus oxalaticus]RKD27046.1 cystathionine gamma-synthase [Ammoniphilus oxalaticus]